MLTHYRMGSVLSRSTHNPRAGLHARLWIPEIREFQTHLTTATAMLSVSFAISVQTDFAAAPHWRATATFNGPYGAVPLFDQFDAMILIAGGSDANMGICDTHGLFTRSPEARIGFV